METTLKEKHMPTPDQILANANANLDAARAVNASPETIATLQQGISVMEYQDAQQKAEAASQHRSSLRGVLTGQVGRYRQRMQATKQFLDRNAQAGQSDIANALQQNRLAGIVRSLEEAPLALMRTVARGVLYAWNKSHHYAAITKVEKAFESAGITRRELGMSRRQFRKAVTNG